MQGLPHATDRGSDRTGRRVPAGLQGAALPRYIDGPQAAR
jgi:hypothetical protein